MKEYQLQEIEHSDIKQGTLNLGLEAGYTTNKEYLLDHVIALYESWLTMRAKHNLPVFPIKITPIYFVYAYMENATPAINQEPGLEINIEIMRKHWNSDFDNDEKILRSISDLGSWLGSNLEQDQIHLSFNNQKYILK